MGQSERLVVATTTLDLCWGEGTDARVLANWTKRAALGASGQRHAFVGKHSPDEMRVPKNQRRDDTR